MPNTWFCVAEGQTSFLKTAHNCMYSDAIQGKYVRLKRDSFAFDSADLSGLQGH